MSIKFEVKMTKQAMYDFMLYTSYRSIGGLAGTLLGFVTLVLGIRALYGESAQSAAPFFLITILFLVATPLNLKIRSSEQVAKTPMFQKPICYEMNEEGIRVSQDGESIQNAWGDFYKAVSTSRSLILYVSKMRALIFPREALGEDYPAAVQMISTHMPPRKVKIRHVSS